MDNVVWWKNNNKASIVWSVLIFLVKFDVTIYYSNGFGQVIFPPIYLFMYNAAFIWSGVPE